jgi:MFS transporter, DHA1 family, tetracycline resistance protein
LRERSTTRRARRPATPLMIIFAAVVTDLLGYGIVVPLLPITIERLGGSATLVGVLAGGYMAIQAISGPLLGRLSDRWGRRPILLICLLGTGLSYLLLGLADTLPLLIGAMLLDALTGANLSTAQAYVADSSPPDRRAHNYGLLGIAFGIGVTVGPALGGLLSQFGPGVPALVAAAMAGVNLVLMAIALPESLPRSLRGPAPHGHIDQPRWSVVLRPLAGTIAMIALVNLAFSGLQSNFPIYSRARFGWGATSTGALFAFVGACAIMTQGLLVGRLRALLSEAALVRIGAALMALSLPLIGLASAAWMIYPLAAAVALGSSLCIPALTSMLANQADERGRGSALGAQQVAINIALATGPLIAGLSYDRWGASAPYMIGGGCALAAALIAGRGDP